MKVMIVSDQERFSGKLSSRFTDHNGVRISCCSTETARDEFERFQPDMILVKYESAEKNNRALKIFMDFKIPVVFLPMNISTEDAGEVTMVEKLVKDLQAA